MRAAEEAPSPILPATNEIIWSGVPLLVILLLAAVAIGTVVYVLRTRRVAEEALDRAAAAEAAIEALREGQNEMSVG